MDLLEIPTDHREQPPPSLRWSIHADNHSPILHVGLYKSPIIPKVQYDTGSPAPLQRNVRIGADDESWQQTLRQHWHIVVFKTEALRWRERFSKWRLLLAEWCGNEIFRT